MRACNNLPQSNPYILVFGGCGRLLHALTPPRSAFLYLQFLVQCHPYIQLHFYTCIIITNHTPKAKNFVMATRNTTRMFLFIIRMPGYQIKIYNTLFYIIFNVVRLIIETADGSGLLILIVTWSMKLVCIIICVFASIRCHFSRRI